MEIPSSSPVYSPLRPESNVYQLGEEDKVVLFPRNDNEDVLAQETPIPETLVEDSLGDGSLYSSQDAQPQLEGPTHEEIEAEIFSDSELDIPDTDSSDTEMTAGKNTQNYLNALLTESLLESLPLPTEKKEMMRKKFKVQESSS